MYDIFKDIWKRPGPSYSPIPLWFWNDTLDRDELVRQVDDFHRKGVDGFVIHPRQGMAGVDYLSDEYGWSRSVPNLSGKLKRGSLRYGEAVELADALGYDIVWQKRER